jgi:tRNA(Ile)-lysidine synthase
LNFLRNRVRHQLIPHLRQAFNTNIVENLNRLADIFREENAWLEQLISTIIPEVLVAQGKDEIVFSASLLMAQPPAVRRRLIRRALEMVKGDLRRITLAQIDAIVELIDKNQVVTLDMPDGVLAAKSGDRLTFCPASAWQTDMAASARVFSYTLFPGGAADVSLAIPEIGARIDFSVITREDVDSVIAGDERVAFFDLERLTLPLTIRNVLPGDRFVPLGMTGRQKVKDFFINRKIPRDHRRACPVVVSGGQIIWLAGFRSADPVKIIPATSRVLKAEVFPL